MEDSGYYSHRLSGFKFSGATGSTARIPAPDDIFSLSYSDLSKPKYRYFRYGFTDEEDFEEFKEDLRNFRRLKRETKEEFVDDSPPCSPRGISSRKSGGSTGSGEFRDAETIKVSETHRSTEEVREGRGDEYAARGHRDNGNTDEWPGTRIPQHTAGREEPLGQHSQLRRSVSLRGAAGGGARSKRNGVYFDEDCFPDESQVHRRASDSGGTRVKEDCGNTRPKRASEGDTPYASGSARLSASDCTRERAPGNDGNESQPRTSLPTGPHKQRTGTGVRRVSFRDTPEKFPSEVEVASLCRETPGPSLRTDAGDSPLSQERKPHCDERSVATRPKTCPEPDNRGRSTQPISIPIQYVSTPVGNKTPAENIDHYSVRDCQRRQTDSTAGVYGNRAEQLDTSTIGANKAEKPRVRSPVTIPIRVERTRENTTAANSQPSDTHLKSERCDEMRGREGNCRQTGIYRKIPKKSYSDGVFSEQQEQSQSSFSQPRQSGDQEDQAQSSFSHSCRRSGLLENLKRLSRSLDRPRSGREVDPFMEFFSGDEHFQEFERVFETINNRGRFSHEMDYRRPGSWREASTERDPYDPFDDSDLGTLHIDDTFSDFFDHDEDFMEFERELEKIKSDRRSRLLESLSRQSSCDIISDVKAFCDRSLSRSRQNLAGSGASPKMERRTSARDSADPELWNSAEEWEFVLNKLKRNSRLFSDLPRTPKGDDSVPDSPTNQPKHSGHLDQCPCLTDCQYTCHQNCVPSVTLDCTTVSPGSGDGPVATPTDLPSPSASAETSLIERRTIVNHRSHQQQQQQATSSANSTPSRHLSQPCINVEHVHSGRQQTSSPHNVLLSTDVTRISDVARVTDPLSGASVLQTSTSAPLLSSASQCVERDLNQNAKTFGVGEVGPECRLLGDDLLVCDVANEKDETDSGYRSGTIPDEKLPRAPSQATLNRRELNRKIQTFNHYVPKAALEELEDGDSFQGFIKVTLNLIRPITMELGARPPSIYELLTREHIVEQSTQHIAFYMPRDTVKSIHINSKTTTKEVITSLLKKFHILDNPRKFAMYEQEFNEKNKLVRLRRLTDKDFPLTALLSWDPERIKFYRLVLQENETGEIVWDAFSLPELGNFLQVLDKEEQEAKAQLQYKYRIMRRIILQRLKELRKERAAQADSVA